MYGITVAEQLRGPSSTTFLERLLDGDELSPPTDTPDLRGYVELALRGGFPEALDLSDEARARWMESYIEQLVTRDALQAGGGRRDPAMLRRYFDVLGLNTAGVVNDKVLYDSAGITRQTAHDYEQLFINLRVVEHVPTWTSNRLKRLVRTPKRYLVDAALVAGAIGVDIDGVMRSGDLLGRIVDTFVASQLRAELPLGRRRPRLFHIRDADGRHEVDLVAEFGGQQLVAMEIKADATPRPSAAKHLAWFRDQVGDQFVAGVVFHTGSRVYPLGDRIIAAPMATIWT
jgi:predicted AAA+ superfamily ATPase